MCKGEVGRKGQGRLRELPIMQRGWCGVGRKQTQREAAGQVGWGWVEKSPGRQGRTLHHKGNREPRCMCK